MKPSPNKEFYLQFGANLRRIRESKGFSQEKLADKAESTSSQVSRIEMGIGNPTLKTLKILADVLEVDIQVLFTFE